MTDYHDEMKACCNCGTVHGPRQRVCRFCKCRAIWRPLTEAEKMARREHMAKVEATFRSLIGERIG